MRLSGLVWDQHHEVEEPVSINRSRDLQAGDSGSCCTEQGKALFGTAERGIASDMHQINWVLQVTEKEQITTEKKEKVDK